MPRSRSTTRFPRSGSPSRTTTNLEGVGDDGAAAETAYVAVTEEPAHVANGTRIAFKVGDARGRRPRGRGRASAGAELSGPKPMPYGPGYYAVYFDDPPETSSRSMSAPSSR